MVGYSPWLRSPLLGFFMPLLIRKRLTPGGLLDKASAWLLYAMYWSGVTIFFVLCSVEWVFGRYLVDFAALLTFAGASVAAILWQALPAPKIRYALSWGLVAATIYGALSNMALAMPKLDAILRYIRR